ncbi:MAG: DUF362 domain-containing protein [Candidatus Bathyarchaeota archaeon]|nr:MAG: DUF362 domain-containing protein [Candidatus Bathyarchaeota archaeon]
MDGSKVAILEVRDDVAGAVRRCVDLAGGLGLSGGEHVVIKPNVCNAKNPYGMVITDFGVVEAVIGLVKEKTDRITVVESDNISGTATDRVRRSGLSELMKGLGVEFLNLSEDEGEVHEVAGKKLRLPRTVLDADRFINLPKMKTEGHVSVTLSVKNLFGVPMRRRKSQLHGRLDEILPYLAKTVVSDLVVVDGITAMEGNGPIIGTPRELGIIVAGTNAVSVDAVCANIMGFDPHEIRYLARAHEIGLGEIDVERIHVAGEDWRRFAVPFERPYSLMATLKSVRSIRKVYL